LSCHARLRNRTTKFSPQTLKRGSFVVYVLTKEPRLATAPRRCRGQVPLTS
jgi:hypothetical protein